MTEYYRPDYDNELMPDENPLIVVDHENKQATVGIHTDYYHKFFTKDTDGGVHFRDGLDAVDRVIIQEELVAIAKAIKEEFGVYPTAILLTPVTFNSINEVEIFGDYN